MTRETRASRHYSTSSPSSSLHIFDARRTWETLTSFCYHVYISCWENSAAHSKHPSHYIVDTTRQKELTRRGQLSRVTSVAIVHHHHVSTIYTVSNYWAWVLNFSRSKDIWSGGGSNVTLFPDYLSLTLIWSGGGGGGGGINATLLFLGPISNTEGLWVRSRGKGAWMILLGRRGEGDNSLPCGEQKASSFLVLTTSSNLFAYISVKDEWTHTRLAVCFTSCISKIVHKDEWRRTSCASFLSMRHCGLLNYIYPVREVVLSIKKIFVHAKTDT